MTRKDYVRFAAMLKQQRANSRSTKLADQHSKDVAKVLAADNDRFDRAKFLKACGVES
jgi:hypothetical protein